MLPTLVVPLFVMTLNRQTLLERGVDTILPSRQSLENFLKQAEQEGRRLRVYLGIDPTSPNIHIGHTVPLRKLAHFQQAGHQAILLIGDFTARLGDPDKLSIREPLTKQKVQENMTTYLDQVKTIIDLEGENPVEIRYNSEWSDPMTYEEVISLASNFTVQQMLERDMFQERMKSQKPISLSEFFYPLMQGYDAVALEADVQIGGTDQTFNMLAGRTLNKSLRNKEMFVLTTPLLADGSGKKIGKTAGNAINVNNPPQELYGQMMSLPDEVIVPGLTMLTDVPEEIIDTAAQQLEAGGNPMGLKKQLAHQVVCQYHGPESANQAAEHFGKTIQGNEIPTDIPTQKLAQKSWNIADLLVEIGLAESKSKARSLFNQGGVEINGKRALDHQIKLKPETIIKVGKRHYKKLYLEEK